DHPEFHPASFADHILVPGRIPNELDIRFIDAVDTKNFALRIMRDGRPHAAARRGECHFHFHPRAAVLFLNQTAIINQTEIDDIDRDLWIIALAQLVPPPPSPPPPPPPPPSPPSPPPPPPPPP